LYLNLQQQHHPLSLRNHHQAAAPPIAPQAPLLSETAQPNGVSSAEEAPLAADFDVNKMDEEIQEGT
jgi:hypothetical protein